MKTITLLTALLILTTNAFAALPKEINSLVGKLGTFTSLYNGKAVSHDNGTDCKVEKDSYGASKTVVIDSVAYFEPTADLNGANKSVSNGVITYETKADGKRPGGSVCGDYIPLTSYKKIVIVTKNSLTIKQNYACAIFDRNEIIQACTIQ